MPLLKCQSTKQVGIAAFIILLILSISISASAQSRQLGEVTSPAPLEDFQPVAENQGWIQLANQIYWTSDNGTTWRDITPDQAVQIRELQFIDPQNGFLVSQQLTHAQEIEYSLLKTGDQGISWEQSTIASYSIRDPRALTLNISGFFLNEQVGWLVFRQGTSANFNIGEILYTHDGGQTWQTISAPLGEPVNFQNQETGYMSGGLASADLYRTNDHGQSWEKIPLADLQLSAIGLPNQLTPQSIFLPAIQSTESGSFMLIFSSQDAGNTWEINHSIKISDQIDLPGTFINLPGEIKVIAGREIYTYFMTTDQITTIEPVGLSNLTHIDFITDQTGWAIANSTNCIDGSAGCVSGTTLLSTNDGGSAWQLIATPSIPVSPLAVTQSDVVELDEVDLLSRTSFLQGQGYDQCEISSLSNLQAWKTNSPLAAVNLYIGGVARGCANTRLNADTGPAFLQALSMQGWKFIPTWVGPQAACTNYSVTMSINPSTAYNQGRDQGMDAVRIARKLGLSEADDSGTVIYYDLEAFNTNDTACLNAAKAFINGWVERLHEAGVTAGVYGSVCASGLADFYNLANRPDVIWPAAWSKSSYYSAVTPYGLPCVSDSLWGDHQRILQYTGPHIETWGNVSMYVDLNVVDGIVSDISRQVGVPSTTLQNPSFETSSLPDWEVNNNPADCNWQVIQSTAGAHSGDYYLAINRNQGDINCTGISQTVTHTPLLGNRYRFAIWARSSSSANPRALTLKLTGEGSSPSSTTKYFSGITDKWVCLETNFDVTSGDLTGITPQIELGNSDGIDVNLDNAHLSVNTALLCPTLPSPTNLGASSGGDQTKVFLRWDAVPTAAFYQVYRSIVPDTTKNFLAQTSSTEYSDSNVTHWDEYNYWVRACTAGQCSQFSQITNGNTASPSLDFFDGFETGDTSKWTTVIQPNLIYACSVAGISGGYGLCLETNTTLPGGSLTYDFSAPTREATVGLKLDPNQFAPGEEIFTILKLVDSSNNLEALRLRLRKIDGQYKIAASGLDRNGVYTTTSWFTIPDSPSEISLLWTATVGQARATAPILSGFTLWINGTAAGPTIRIENQTLIVDRLVIGGLSNSTSSQSSGIVLIDDFYYEAPLYQRQ